MNWLGFYICSEKKGGDVVYRNIDSILKENGRVTLVCCPGRSSESTSEFPQHGEVVGLLTKFSQYLQVRIDTVNSEQNFYQGKVKYEICSQGFGDIDILLCNEERVEFSHSKILGIFRKKAPTFLSAQPA